MKVRKNDNESNIKLFDILPKEIDESVRIMNNTKSEVLSNTLAEYLKELLDMRIDCLIDFNSLEN